SWYIELSKAGLYSENKEYQLATKSTLVLILSGIIRMLHPFMPFVTEEIYQAIPHEFSSIHLAAWPSPIKVAINDKEMNEVQQLLSIIEMVREIKVDYQLKPSMDIQVFIQDQQGNMIEPKAEIQAILNKMCHAQWSVEACEEEMVIRNIVGGTLSVPLASIMNIEEEILKTEKELQKFESEIKRAEGMLSNPNFTQKAPEAKVKAEQEKLANYKEQYALAQKRLQDLKSK
ncbi:MAG: class I tRNA ligase family protein, partial [Erysipelotrichaceae bacterium]|nr:class I tRNA ligase family protein [Erysipelotrichaceae bacterium]